MLRSSHRIASVARALTCCRCCHGCSGLTGWQPSGAHSRGCTLASARPGSGTISSHACFVRQPSAAPGRRRRCDIAMSGKPLAATATIPSQAARYRDCCPQHRCCGQRLRVTHHSNSGDSLRERAATSASSVRGSARGIGGRKGGVGRQHQASALVVPNDGWCPPNARRGTKTRARRWG